jgi:hypothetical protein
MPVPRSGTARPRAHVPNRMEWFRLLARVDTGFVVGTKSDRRRYLLASIAFPAKAVHALVAVGGLGAVRGQ